MHVKTPREVPEYEINPSELDFTQSKEITKVVKKTFVSFVSYWMWSASRLLNIFLVFQGTYCMAMWRGIQVAVKKLDDEVLSDDEQV